jgi:hypothetical protein
MSPSDPREPVEEPENGPETNKGARDEDALWRGIVDNYGDRVVLEPDPEPEQDVPTDRRGPVDGDLHVPGSPRGLTEPAELSAARDDRDDHYVPPPPPPVPRTTPVRMLAWFGLFGVPALVLVFLIAGVTLPPWLGLVLMGWFVGGFVFLVAAMRPDDRDGYDDGAVL